MTKKLTPEIAAKFLAEVPADKYFYLSNAQVLKSSVELGKSLETMPEEVFSSHRNGIKNDFYNWVLFVIGDVRLANEIARAKTKETTLKKVAERIKFLQSVKG